MKHYFAEWDYRFGWGYYSAIMPKEVVDAGASNWKNVNGTGPLHADRLRARATPTSTRRTRTTGTRRRSATQEYKLPFVDKITYRTIKDEATCITALRTGKLDILEAIRWQNVDSLKKSAPQLQVEPLAEPVGHLHGDARRRRQPFKDVRVRRALNMAVNKDEIVKAYYNGNAELFAYPQHPDYIGYFEPLDKQPASVQELFKYDPAKAKKLLAEAGYPKGFTSKVQVCSCNPDHMDLLPLVAAYLEQVGVKLEIQPMEYGAFLSAMTTRTHTAGLLHEQRPHQPDDDHPQELRHGPAVESGRAGRIPSTTRRWTRSTASRDEAKRQKMLREMTHRDPRQGALHLAADAVRLYGVVAVGEEL